MPKNKQIIVALAALLTGIIIIMLRYVSLPGLKVESNWGNFFFVNATLLATNLLAALPGLALLKSQKINHPISLTLAGVIIGYVFTIILGIIATPLGTWTWSLATIVSLVASYLGLDLVLNSANTKSQR